LSIFIIIAIIRSGFHCWKLLLLFSLLLAEVESVRSSFVSGSSMSDAQMEADSQINEPPVFIPFSKKLGKEGIQTGVIVHFKDNKGYGFIAPDSESYSNSTSAVHCRLCCTVCFAAENLFFHISSMRTRESNWTALDLRGLCIFL
jgi:hypothetical protein